MQGRRTISTKLYAVVSHTALVVGCDREGVSVAHGGHTTHTPLTHGCIGVLLGGVSKDRVEPLHVVMVDARTKVTTHKGWHQAVGH